MSLGGESKRKEEKETSKRMGDKRSPIISKVNPVLHAT
jgi:hypothetical protein